MKELDVFLSVGGVATPDQEKFVSAVEDRLRAEGLTPHTVGRNTFSADAPLKTVTELMDRCAGTVVIALERIYFADGLEKRGGPGQTVLSNVKVATPWNQIEAAMAYSRGHPLIVIVEHGIKSEGLLERGYDWYVQWVKPDPAALNTAEFNGVLASWKQKMVTRPTKTKVAENPADLTIGALISSMKPSHLWSVLGAIAVLLAGAFALGGKISPMTSSPPALTISQPPAAR
jgi:hypothetical protein